MRRQERGAWSIVVLTGFCLGGGVPLALAQPPAPPAEESAGTAREVLPAALFFSCQSDCCRWYRICGENRYCPRGACGVEMLSCQRREYAPYVLSAQTGERSVKGIDAQCVPIYRMRCRDFCLRDRCPSH